MSRTIRALTVPLLAVFALAACGGTASADADEDADDGGTMFTAVRDACDLPASTVLDGGTTLNLDGEGNKRDGLTIEQTACALKAIGTPDSIIAQMDQTRALDGRQTAERDGYSYSWTYHPDSGLDIIVSDAWQD